MPAAERRRDHLPPGRARVGRPGRAPGSRGGWPGRRPSAPPV